ncbi:MAG TPA: hypothetical protein VFC03_06970 [Acidimicrobiales bacterium]|nr:hypothetical protein [Acidimicrobiales bacterium]
MTRVRAATAGLIAPPVHDLDQDAVDRVRTRLESGMADAATGLPGGAPLEVGLPLLRRARYRPELLGVPDEPFAWRPAFVRRSLGLEIVRACRDRRYRGPAAAAGPVADHALEEWRRTGWRTFHWEPWVAGLGAGARSVVLAEAVAWATPLWATFDWAALPGTVEFGGPDDRWSCPGVDSVHLKGRCEVRLHLGGTRRSLVSVASGRPGDGWRDELAYVALVATLSAPDRTAARVVGLWPDAGFRLAVEVDEAVLTGAFDRVVDAVAVTAGVRATPPATAVA